jgi:hypothetical protein
MQLCPAAHGLQLLPQQEEVLFATQSPLPLQT